MNAKKWLQHCATEAQLRQFNDEGYLIVEDALSPDLLARLNDAVDRVEARERETKGLKSDALLKKFRTIVEDDVFLELLDNPKTFPLIMGYFGMEYTALHLPSNRISTRAKERQDTPGRLASRRRATRARNGTSPPALIAKNQLLVKQC